MQHRVGRLTTWEFVGLKANSLGKQVSVGNTACCRNVVVAKYILFPCGGGELVRARGM